MLSVESRPSGEGKQILGIVAEFAGAIAGNGAQPSAEPKTKTAPVPGSEAQLTPPSGQPPNR